MSTIPNTSGIYKITCTVTGMFYIGSAVNLRWRKANHFSELQRNKHYNPKLQHAFNKYGPDAFIFEVLELVLPMSLTAREQYWLDRYQPFGKRGFNIAITAGSSLGMKASPITREKLSAARRGNTNHTGKKASSETRKLLSTIRLGKKHTLEHRKNVGQSKLGKKRSPETIEKMRQGRTNTKALIVIAPDGTEQTIYGIRQFCKEHHLDRSNLMHVAKGNKISHKGWKARFPD
jgi:group I intron endonuclease